MFKAAAAAAKAEAHTEATADAVARTPAGEITALALELELQVGELPRVVGCSLTMQANRLPFPYNTELQLYALFACLPSWARSAKKERQSRDPFPAR